MLNWVSITRKYKWYAWICALTTKFFCKFWGNTVCSCHADFEACLFLICLQSWGKLFTFSDSSIKYIIINTPFGSPKHTFIRRRYTWFQSLLQKMDLFLLKSSISSFGGPASIFLPEFYFQILSFSSVNLYCLQGGLQFERSLNGHPISMLTVNWAQGKNMMLMRHISMHSLPTVKICTL